MSRRDHRGRRARVSEFAIAVAVASAVLLTGCSAAEEPDGSNQTSGVASQVLPDVVAGELAGYDGRISVGEEITVLVNLPADAWEIVSSDTDVVEIDTDQRDEEAIVRLVGISVGSSTVVLTNEEGDRDELTVVVSES